MKKLLFFLSFFILQTQASSVNQDLSIKSMIKDHLIGPMNAKQQLVAFSHGCMYGFSFGLAKLLQPEKDDQLIKLFASQFFGSFIQYGASLLSTIDASYQLINGRSVCAGALSAGFATSFTVSTFVLSAVSNLISKNTNLE